MNVDDVFLCGYAGLCSEKRSLKKQRDQVLQQLLLPDYKITIYWNEIPIRILCIFFWWTNLNRKRYHFNGINWKEWTSLLNNRVYNWMQHPKSKWTLKEELKKTKVLNNLDTDSKFFGINMDYQCLIRNMNRASVPQKRRKLFPYLKRLKQDVICLQARASLVL